MDVEASSPSENDDMDLRSAATSPASDLANDADDEPDQVEDHETPGGRLHCLTHSLVGRQAALSQPWNFICVLTAC